ncbi:MAG: hypothetical protein Roseis3KO_54540 [Roseivirga sp.]
MKYRYMSYLVLVLALLFGCKNDPETSPDVAAVDPGNDPNFTIVVNSDKGFSAFNRKVVVFDIDIYAVAGVEDRKLLHAANLMAQYLDNDEDGIVDDMNVLNAMKAEKAFMVMWKYELDLENIDPPNGREGQDLGNDETRPEWHFDKSGEFDAALEEVWHIITHAGYANAYPPVFGETAGTTLTNAMDLARGGNFTSIPDSYPAAAWYTYDDATCEYDCMSTEYIYWAMTSILGAQQNRLNEIGHEWRLNTREKVEQGDPAIYTLLTGTDYHLPTVLPDGSYKH